MDLTYEDVLKEIENELYQALEALQEEDLPTVRSSAARAQNGAIAAWQKRKVRNEGSK